MELLGGVRRSFQSAIVTLKKETKTMNRREFAAAGLSGATLATFAGRSFARDDQTQEHKHDEHDHDGHVCAKACSACQRECDSCATHCGQKLLAGKADHIKSMLTCQDCADVCATAARIVSRGGPFSVLLCEACAAACSKCAAQCEKFPDDEHMQKCAKQCLACREACLEMTRAAGKPA
jgi:hypothetical protein